MDPAATSPQPPEPPRDLLSSERVHFLTSWKLWLPMLFAALILIAAGIVWPAYRRMQALDLIESRDGSYTLGEARWPWLAGKFGRLGLGYHAVDDIEVHQPLSLEELDLLTSLNEAERVTITAKEITTEWLDAIASFPRLKSLAVHSEINVQVLEELLARVPTLASLRVDILTAASPEASVEVDGVGSRLEELYVRLCDGPLKVVGFFDLNYLWLEQMAFSAITVRELPALREIYIVHANEETQFHLDQRLPRLSYGLPSLSRLEVPSMVENMYIQNIARCTITGGEDLESLSIYESSDIRVENMPMLRSLEFTTSFGGTLRLHDLPVLEHLMLMTRDAHISPALVFDGVDNLRAIDAPWWRVNEEYVEPICDLPKLEHLVISRTMLSEQFLAKLHAIETLRFLRIPRYWSFPEYKDVDFTQLRQSFPQPGIRIHGPPRVSEEENRWTPP